MDCFKGPGIEVQRSSRVNLGQDGLVKEELLEEAILVYRLREGGPGDKYPALEHGGSWERHPVCGRCNVAEQKVEGMLRIVISTRSRAHSSTAIVGTLTRSIGEGTRPGGKEWGKGMKRNILLLNSRHSLATGNDWGEDVALHRNAEGQGHDIEEEKIGSVSGCGLAR